MINLFKQKDGFVASTFSGLIKDGVEQIPEEIKDQLIQVDDEVYKDLVEHKLMWKDGELINNPDYEAYQAEKELKELKKTWRKELNDIHEWFNENDWKPNKIITGEWQIDDQRWIDYLNERAIKRARQDELNELLTN